MMRALVLAPHPDDEVVGCGGSIAKLSAAGHHVAVAYVTSGEAGSLDHSAAALAALREAEAVASCAVLGVGARHFLRRPDGYVAADAVLLAEITRLIRAERPDRLYLPHVAEAHPDHRVVGAVAVDAAGRAGGPWFADCGAPWRVATLLAYEVWTPLQQPSYFEDVSAEMETKLAALARHVSQTAEVAYGDAVRGLNRYRGAMSGLGTYVEAFQVLRTGTV